MTFLDFYGDHGCFDYVILVIIKISLNLLYSISFADKKMANFVCFLSHFLDILNSALMHFVMKGKLEQNIINNIIFIWNHFSMLSKYGTK